MEKNQQHELNLMINEKFIEKKINFLGLSMISFGTHIDMIFNTIVTGNILLGRLFMMCDL